MIYVMTGLRGDFKKYVELKNSLIMKKSDDLYLVGGILGGSGGIDILLDAMSEENVFPIAGKDELLALKYLDFMKNNDKSDDLEIKKGMADWFKNGGYPTAEAFTKLDEEDKEALLDYLREDFTLCEEIETKSGSQFVVSYAGLGDFDPDREIGEYSPEDLTEGDYTPNCFFDDKYIICGNLFDFDPEDDAFEGKIYHSENVIVLNHATNENTVCIRLDDMKEYYAD